MNACCVVTLLALLTMLLSFGTATNAIAQNSDLSIDLTSTANALSAGDARSLTYVAVDRQLKILKERISSLQLRMTQLPTEDLSQSTELKSKLEAFEREYQELLDLIAPPNLSKIPYLLSAVPASYNSNPTLKNSGETGSAQIDPKLQVHQFLALGGASIDFSGTFDLNRYPSVSAANANNAQSVLTALFGQESVTPYGLWQLAYKSPQTSGGLTTTTNDLGGGFKWTPTGVHQATSDLYVAPLPTVSISMDFTRRFTNSGVDSDSLYLKGAVTFIDQNASVGATLTPSVRVRWYDQIADSRRRDTTVTLPLQISWYPDLLQKNLAGTCLFGSVQLSAQGVRIYSTDPTKDARQWNVGAAISIAFWDGTRYVSCE